MLLGETSTPKTKQINDKKGYYYIIIYDPQQGYRNMSSFQKRPSGKKEKKPLCSKQEEFISSINIKTGKCRTRQLPALPCFSQCQACTQIEVCRVSPVTFTLLQGYILATAEFELSGKSKCATCMEGFYSDLSDFTDVFG